MAYKYPIDKLYGSVSWSLSDALLTYCPPANSAAEMQQEFHYLSTFMLFKRSQMTNEFMLCISQHSLPK